LIDAAKHQSFTVVDQHLGGDGLGVF
jgi:hypothetical protein